MTLALAVLGWVAVVFCTLMAIYLAPCRPVLEANLVQTTTPL